MARPKKGYGVTADGVKRIGVTTPKSYWGNKMGMVHKAWQLGMEGLNYRDIWWGAANAGTGAHTLIEAHLNGEPEPKLSDLSEEERDKAETAYLGFLKWADLVDFKVIATEISLFDDAIGLAGTPDLAAVQGKRCIIDWKTSKDIYPEDWAQIAAYKHLWEVNHPDEPIEDCYILQLNKETGGFSYHHIPDVSVYWDFYQLIFKAYRIYKEKMGGK